MRAFLICILSCFLLSQDVASQLENINWFFGTGVQLNFGATGPTLGAPASLDASGFNQPSCISSADGIPVLYTDGAAVYNGSGDLVQNGDFSPASTENLFVPDPGNANRYYLFQSGNNGLKYSIVDMSLNNGAGGINDNEKNISLSSQNCHLASAGHATDNAFWIAAGHNNNGNSDDVTVNIYALTASGVALSSTFAQYYLFGGWFGALDDMRISPDCGKIGLVFKGHYLVMMRLNNTDGTVYDAFPSAMDLTNSFTTLDFIEFSPNSEYVWSLGDNSGVSRYSLANWSPGGLQGSEEILVATQFGSGAYNDLKLGPDGNLYLHRAISNVIDRVVNPDAPFSELSIEQSSLSVPSGLTNKFPNTANLSCLPPSISLTIHHQFECLGDLTEFWYTSAVQLDSLTWNFGDPSSGLANTSELDEPVHQFTATGPYNITLTGWVNGMSTDYIHSVTIYDVPNLNLGPDFILCEGNIAVLDSGISGFSQVWNTGATTPSISVNAGGTYSLNVTEGTCVRSDTVIVTLINELFLSAVAPASECNNQPVQINAAIGFSDSFSWSTGETTPSITVTEGGTYILSAENECFTESLAVTITYVDIPENLLGEDRLGCAGDGVALFVDYPNGSFVWNTGDTDASIQALETGTYSVTVNYLGCLRSDEVEVEIIDFVPVEEIVMPNIFTPNGDDKNAVFRPFLPESPDLDLCELPVLNTNLRVYNRWGGLITEGGCEWRGDYSGDELDEGTYYYIIDLESQCNQKGGQRTIEGHFTLLRK